MSMIPVEYELTYDLRSIFVICDEQSRGAAREVSLASFNDNFNMLIGSTIIDELQTAVIFSITYCALRLGIGYLLQRLTYARMAANEKAVRRNATFKMEEEPTNLETLPAELIILIAEHLLNHENTTSKRLVGTEHIMCGCEELEQKTWHTMKLAGKGHRFHSEDTGWESEYDEVSTDCMGAEDISTEESDDSNRSAIMSESDFCFPQYEMLATDPKFRKRLSLSEFIHPQIGGTQFFEDDFAPDIFDGFASTLGTVALDALVLSGDSWNDLAFNDNGSSNIFWRDMSFFDYHGRQLFHTQAALRDIIPELIAILQSS